MRRQHLAARAPAPQGAGRRERHLRPARPADRLGRADACGRASTGRQRDAVSRWLWKDRKLVRTWAQRGTLHLLRADELGLWVGAQSALKPRHHVGSWLRHYGLTREQADAMLDAIPVALDGKQLTREELAAEVARVTGIKGLDDKLKGGFGDLLKPAAFRGDLCFAPSDGQRVRFARPDQWLGPWRADGRGGGDARGRAPVPDALRPGQPRGSRALVRDDIARRGRALAEGAGRRGGRGPAASTCWRPTPRRPRRGAGRRRAAPAGLRPVRRRRAARRRRRRPRREACAASTGRRAGCRRCCSVDGHIAGVWSHEPRGRPA